MALKSLTKDGKKYSAKNIHTKMFLKKSCYFIKLKNKSSFVAWPNRAPQSVDLSSESFVLSQLKQPTFDFLLLRILLLQNLETI